MTDQPRYNFERATALLAEFQVQCLNGCGDDIESMKMSLRKRLTTMTVDHAIDTMCEIVHLTDLEKGILLTDYEIMEKSPLVVHAQDDRTLYETLKNSAKNKIALTIFNQQRLIQLLDVDVMYN
ncbi:MAG: hypothetical protein Q7R96_05690 [Nanoarchaeota archaeon]|nr:hypothetical protein [Nanoarchaeota archaeon]